MASWLRRQFLKVIQWEDDSSGTIVYKYPLEKREEVMKNSKLVVREGQKAAILVNGQLADVFEPGTYKLSQLENIPVLTTLLSWKYFWESPFTGDIFFINSKQFINNKWGTATPVMMRDKEFGMIRLRGYGSYSFRVDNIEKTLKELFGTMHLYTVEHVQEYLKKIVVSIISDTLAESKIPAMDLAQNYTELSELSRKNIQKEFEKFGLLLQTFYIENLSLPEDVSKIIDKRTQMGIMSDSMGQFAQYQAIEAMGDAAKNPGGAAGIGVGVGAGVGIGRQFSQAFSDAANTEKKDKCPNCFAVIRAGSKFCPECGKPTKKEVKCIKCGVSIPENVKFCPECGEKQITENKCSKCGVQIKQGTKFCPECGEKQ